MQYQILKEPMALLDVQLNAGEKITAESGAMVYVKGDVEIKTRTREGGLFKKLKVSALGGESFFVNDYIARSDVSIGLTGPPLGDIIRIEIRPGSGRACRQIPECFLSESILWQVPLPRWLTPHPPRSSSSFRLP